MFDLNNFLQIHHYHLCRVKNLQNKNEPRTGAFEITVNNKLIYSKLQTNNFPTKDEIRALLND